RDERRADARGGRRRRRLLPAAGAARRTRLGDRNRGMNDTTPALRMEGVRKTYHVAGDEVVALDHADLEVAPGEIVTLVGPAGSGKTTLCSIAGGLLSPTEGTVAVGGEDITRYTPRQLTEFRRTTVGFVFQSVNLVPFLTARENLLVVDELAGR